MEIQPLNKKLYQMAKEIGIKSFTLHFEGGDDEGFLSVSCKYDPKTAHRREVLEFEREVEEWAYGLTGVYEYSGAGDGYSYGDDIHYDLVSGKCSHSEWYTARTDGDSSSCKLSIAEDCEEDFE